MVVLDDASTDGTGRVARAWAYDRRFRYVCNDRNLGRVANYRRGLSDHARGDWVLMLDGDDYLADPGFIGRAARLSTCTATGRSSSPRPGTVSATSTGDGGTPTSCRPSRGPSGC